MWVSGERRVRRSDDRLQALQFLFATQRERAALSHLLVATEDGILVAHDGDTDECEELAAYAPFVARGAGMAIDPRRITGVTAHAFPVDGQELYLLLRSESPKVDAIPAALTAIQGAIRILGR